MLLVGKKCPCMTLRSRMQPIMLWRPSSRGPTLSSLMSCMRLYMQRLRLVFYLWLLVNFFLVSYSTCVASGLGYRCVFLAWSCVVPWRSLSSRWAFRIWPSVHHHQLMDMDKTELLQVVENSAKFDMLLKVKRGEKEEKFKVEVHKNHEGGLHLNQMVPEQ